MSESTTQAEAHHQEPRHYYEAPLLLIFGPEPEEWVVKLDHGCAIPVCRYIFGEDGREPERPGPDTKPLPDYAIQALREYDGPYSDTFDQYWTFHGPAKSLREEGVEGNE